MSETIHKGDIGTIFEATLVEYDVVLDADVPLDLSSATELQLIFQSAHGVLKPVDAILATDGTDGVVTYTTPDIDFLDSSGWWRWQVAMALPGWAGHSDVLDFEVHANLGD